jgi:hypothetical protein
VISEEVEFIGECPNTSLVVVATLQHQGCT